jgi:hypothetical protein
LATFPARIAPRLSGSSGGSSTRRCSSLPTERCAVASRARGDVLAGTAPPVDRFLLVEHRGPWGASAHPTTDLPKAPADNIRTAAARLGARVLLIRRPGRAIPSPVRSWAVADTRAGHESLAWGTYVADALATASFDPVEATPTGRRAYLVCTQGRHDQCCAIDGRPVATALAAARPEETWECTHVGGDRFAANLVLLPHGLTYGRVDGTTAIAVVEAYESGHVVPQFLRGRTSGAPALQYVAAQVRQRTGSTGVGDIEPLTVTRAGHDEWRVVLRLQRTTVYAAHVHERHRRVATHLTCAGIGPGTVRTFEVISLDQVDA